MKKHFDYKEYENWVKKLGIAKQELDDWLKQFILLEGFRVVANAQLRQEQFTYTNAQGEQKIGLIDTGTMIRSWKVGEVQTDGHNVYVEISNNVEYASFIEYGQRSFGGAYLLTVAIDEIQKQIPARFNKEWLQWLRSKGVAN